MDENVPCLMGSGPRVDQEFFNVGAAETSYQRIFFQFSS